MIHTPGHWTVVDWSSGSIQIPGHGTVLFTVHPDESIEDRSHAAVAALEQLHSKEDDASDPTGQRRYCFRSLAMSIAAEHQP